MAEGNYFAWIAIDETGQSIGFIEATVRPYANGCETRPVAFLEGIWVAERYRGKRVARSLVEVAEKWALAQGLSEIASDAEISNEASIRAHLAWGFKERERVVYFRKVLRPS